ncbi:S1C family serine protease [Streptomyces sp. SP18CS02]|uniref:S1C family serine protease n=1 Tax=Streptomyces sp. SP18CS02 TaxID=3002531 RepID=UPI002E791F56|nr:trypsin-like peptidase domain-containing protein [Streptomyces sp. SP18CS02]MEE1754282.1 trypsin-like peptidase domain-containing protein [Streptomyces sp. SP18CS02]
MSTENEGTAVPSAPSAPPVPVAAPEGTPASAPAAHEPGTAPEPGPGYSPRPAAGAAPLPEPPPAAPSAPQPGHAPAAPTHAPAAPPHAPAPVTARTDGGAGWPPAPPTLPSYGGGHGDGSGGGAWGAPVPTPGPAQHKRSGGGLVAAVLVAALVAGGIGGGVGYWAAQREDDPVSSTTVSAGETRADFKRDPGTVAAVANNALPSVVTIEAKSGGSESEGGTGTGFVYDKEGHILTNNHVVASAAEGGTLSATFSDGKKYDAEVVGRAQGYDVAVLKLKKAPAGLKPLALGNSDQVVVGDSTIAIGAPFGLSNTVTTGIISAKNRPVASGDGSSGKNSYMSALQTDASINPGNSGGPLLDARGAVIGINSAIQSAGSGLGQSQAGSIGLGFAIPINQAKSVAEQLIRTGQPVYSVIGATVNMTEEGAGATIAGQGAGGTPAVTPDGPAAKAGLKPGDVITKFGDRTIDSGPTLISEIWTHEPGDKVALTYQRGGKETTVEVTLGERKGDS